MSRTPAHRQTLLADAHGSDGASDSDAINEDVLDNVFTSQISQRQTGKPSLTISAQMDTKSSYLEADVSDARLCGRLKNLQVH